MEIEYDGEDEDTALLVVQKKSTGDIITASNIDSKVFSITSDGKISVGNIIPAVSLDLSFHTDALKLPQGNNTTRPEINDNDESHQGLIRYNTESKKFEGLGAGNNWGSLGGVIDADQDTKILADDDNDNDELQFYTEGSMNMVILKNGNVGIGTDIPQKKLHVSGDIVATNKITSYYSDERLKTNIENIKEPLELIKNLNGFYYTPNELAESFGIKSNNREVGLSAQEVNKILPELTDLAPFDMCLDNDGNIKSKSGNNYLTISYERMVPVIIESLKELTREVEALKKENKILKEKIM